MITAADTSWRLLTLLATLSSWIHVIISQNMPTPANLPPMFRPASSGAPGPTRGPSSGSPPGASLPPATLPGFTVPAGGGVTGGTLALGGFATGGFAAGGFASGGLTIPSASFLGVSSYASQPNVITGLCTFGCPPVAIINVTVPPPQTPPPTTTTTTTPTPRPVVPTAAVVPYAVGCPILACLCQLCPCPICTTCGIGGIAGIGAIGFG